MRRAPCPGCRRSGCRHGYTTAFASAAGIFALGAIIAGALFERGGQIDTSAQAALA